MPRLIESIPAVSEGVKEGLLDGQVARLLRERYTETDKQLTAHGKWAAANQPNAHVFTWWGEGRGRGGKTRSRSRDLLAGAAPPLTSGLRRRAL